MAGPALAVSCFLALAFLGLGPRTGAYRVVTVLTGSMGSTASAGSVVVSTPKPASEVVVGDVITYAIPIEDRRVVTHRVVEITESGPSPAVRTQGDANPAPDPWLARLEPGPVWTARFAVPAVGRAIAWLRHPWLQHLLVRGVPALLALVWLRDIWRPANSRRGRASLGGVLP